MTAHDPATKAAVVAALLTGQGVNAVAREYHIPQRTVSDWKKAADALVSGAVRSEKERIDISDALTRYLSTALATLVVQLQHAASPTWLADQDAAGLAVLHGVLVDKVIRLLEAAEAGAAAEYVDGFAVPADPEAAGVP